MSPSRQLSPAVTNFPHKSSQKPEEATSDVWVVTLNESRSTYTHTLAWVDF